MALVHLTPQLVDAVRDTADVVDIASEHTRLTKSGRRLAGLCPLHKEKTPSFSVDPAKGLFYCFGCGQGGDAIKLHMLLSGDDFPMAIESLAQRYGIPLPTSTPKRREEIDRSRRVSAALEAAHDLFRRHLAESDAARGYLERRRIPPELAERYGLGYAPDDWRALTTALGRTHSTEVLLAAGLVARSERTHDLYDRFRHRLVFPIHTPSGRLVGFGGRTLGDDRAKYVNTAETESFHKARLLYGLHLVRREMRETSSALLVEGYFDVVGAAAAGAGAAVASMGTSLTREQARLLARYADEVIVGYDGDEAGDRAFRRALPVLLAAGLAVRRARFGEGHDPDSLRLESGDEEVRRAVRDAVDAVELELARRVPADAHREPRRQAAAAGRALELLGAVPDPILRFGYARRAATRLALPVELIVERLRRRSGGDEGEAERAPAEPRSGPSPVRSLEERTLELLLDEEVELPAAGELPPDEAFLDPTWRNIYRSFRALTGEKSARKPSARELIATLGEEGDSVDRAARLLLEGRSATGAEELSSCLEKLRHRWRRERRRKLVAEIRQAQLDGDEERLGRLLEEKLELSRLLHRSGESS